MLATAALNSMQLLFLLNLLTKPVATYFVPLQKLHGRLPPKPTPMHYPGSCRLAVQAVVVLWHLTMAKGIMGELVLMMHMQPALMHKSDHGWLVHPSRAGGHG